MKMITVSLHQTLIKQMRMEMVLEMYVKIQMEILFLIVMITVLIPQTQINKTLMEMV